MKKRISEVLMFVLILTISGVFASCGGGGGGGSDPPSDPPTISNLAFSPSKAEVGPVTVNFSFDFADQGGNVTSYTVTDFQGNRSAVSINNGNKSGTITGTAVFQGLAQGSYNFSVFVTDSSGATSNALSGTIATLIPPAPPAEASAVIDSSGGIIEVTNPSSSLYGAKIVVPQGAIDAGQSMEIRIASYSSQSSEQILFNTEKPVFAVQLSPLVNLVKTGTQNSFNLPVSVTLPYSVSGVGSSDVPCVFNRSLIWGEPLMAMGVKNIVRTADSNGNGRVTFTTVHFSDYVVLGIQGLATTPTAVNLGFDPAIDAFPLADYGAASPWSSFSNAAYSAWFFRVKKNDPQLPSSPLRTQYPAGAYSDLESNIAAAAQPMWSNPSGAGAWRGGFFTSPTAVAPYGLSQSDTGLILLTAMRVSGAPQVMILKGDSTARAVLIYDYDGSAFSFYDTAPPSPASYDLAWSTGGSFSPVSYTPGFAITGYDFEALSSVHHRQVYENYSSGAESNWTSIPFTGCSGAGSTGIGYNQDFYYVGNTFAWSESTTISRISVLLTKVSGDISGKSFVLRIWNLDASSNLTTQLAASAPVTGSNSWNRNWVEFNFSPPVQIAAGTYYGISLDMGGLDANNYAQVYYGSSTYAGYSAQWRSTHERWVYKYDLDLVTRFYR